MSNREVMPESPLLNNERTRRYQAEARLAEYEQVIEDARAVIQELADLRAWMRELADELEARQKADNVWITSTRPLVNRLREKAE